MRDTLPTLPPLGAETDKASLGASISIIVPVLDEAVALPELLANLQTLRRNGCEILVVDGGSEDASVAIAERLGFTVLQSLRGRARQMNAGARVALGEVLLFLHADTQLPPSADALIRQSLSHERSAWGFFRVRIQGRPRMLRMVSFLMNCRSRLTSIATGDHALFVRRAAFESIGGFPDQALMEDVELSRRLKRIAAPVRVRVPVTTSGRRWEACGVWRTIFLMWRLRLAYALGAHPDALARIYR
jgi:rSAM/selenodomain-associated transferase 2